MSIYKFCVMGHPIEHSQSPWIHAQFAEQAKLAISYIKIKPDLDRFAEEVEQFRIDGGSGLNVTHPFKQEAYRLASRKTERAEIAKSVNTILFREGEIIGDNTDGIGLIRDITKNLRYSLTGKTIVIFGAGGAVRGILDPILKESPKEVIIVNRTRDKATQLVSEFSSFKQLYVRNLDGLRDFSADVVIDGTTFFSPAEIPASFSLNTDSLCYDLKYSTTPTAFMQWSKEKNGKIISDGLGLLIEQAAESFFVWTGFRPDTQAPAQSARNTERYLSR